MKTWLWQEQWVPQAGVGRALGICIQDRKIAFVGAGGKTTLLFALADEMRQEGRRVLVTTSTHIRRPAGFFVTAADLSGMQQAWDDGQGIVVLGQAAEDGKLKPARQEICRQAEAMADVVLVEADGSRGLPCKAPAAHEPVLAGDEDLVVAVGGFSAIGGTLRAVCHRSQQAAACLQTNSDAVLTAENLAYLLTAPAGGRKGVPGRFAVVLNQVNTSKELCQAENCARAASTYLPEVRFLAAGREPLAAVVLAAGLSRRMAGQDKLLQDFAGQPLFAYALDAVASLPVQERIVVTNTACIRERACRLGFRAVGNPIAAKGQATSVVCGVQQVGRAAAGVWFFNADQPFLCPEVLNCLLEAFWQHAGRAIIVPRVAGKPQSACIFPAAFLPELAVLEGDQGGRQVYARHLPDVVFFDFTDRHVFLDIDTIEDREKALGLLEIKKADEKKAR